MTGFAKMLDFVRCFPSKYDMRILIFRSFSGKGTHDVGTALMMSTRPLMPLFAEPNLRSTLPCIPLCLRIVPSLPIATRHSRKLEKAWCEKEGMWLEGTSKPRRTTERVGIDTEVKNVLVQVIFLVLGESLDARNGCAFARSV